MAKFLQKFMPGTIALLLVCGFFIFGLNKTSAEAGSPTAVDLGSAGNFVILSQTGITNTGSHTSVLTGNIGSSPISATAMDNVFCSEITGTIYGVDAAYVGSGSQTCFAGNPPLANKTLVDNAIGDMGTAYTDAAGRTPDATELYAGDLSSQTFTPGVYKWSTDVSINTDVTLSGSSTDVWIFEIAGNLNVASAGDVASGVKVILSGGAKASNIFWQVGGATGATLGTYSTFNGNILSAKQIIIQTGAVLDGRALAQTQVTLDANTITAPIDTTKPVFIDKNNNHLQDVGELSFATIQGAIDVAISGDTIAVTPGTYNQDEANGYDAVTGDAGSSNFNIFVNKSVTIEGVDANGNLITDAKDVVAFIIPKRDTPSGNLSTIFVQADNVTISGLDVTAYDDPDYNFKTISVTGDNVTIKNCKLHAGDQVSSIYMYDPNYDVGTNTSHIQSYKFENNSLEAGGIYASGIRISSGPGWSGDVANRIISGNAISDGSYGIEFVGPGGDDWDVYPVGAATVTTNSFSGQDKGSVVAWGKYNETEGYGSIDWDSIFSQNTFDKAVITKTPENTIRYYNYLGGPTFYFIRGIYSAIQRYPINQVAQSGDTINVASGTYNESLLIEKPLTLSGSGITKPVISGQSGNDYIIKINGASGVILDNLEINGGGTTVGNNDFAYGILVNNSGASDNAIEIKNSVIKNIWQNGSNGIGAEVSSYVLAHNNTLSSFHKRGIRFINSDGKFYNNEVIGDNVDGTSRVQNLVNLWGGSTVEIYNNILHNALSAPGSTPTWDSPGIFVSSYGGDGASQANIHDNDIYSCDTGVVMGSVYADVDTSSADIMNNNFHDLNSAINFEKATASATVNGNSFVDNIGNITANEDIVGPAINAETNWWGTDIKADVESKIYLGVDFEPYYTNVAKTTLSDETTTDAVYTSATDGQADLPTDATEVVLTDTTVMDLSNSVVAQTAEDVTIGGSIITLTQEVILQSGIDTQPIVLTNSDLSGVSASIPDGTTIQGPVGWDGTITPPISGTPTGGIAPAGFSVGDTIISIGSPNGTLVFDNPVTILLSGVTGAVGYRPSGSDNWIQITNVCGGDYVAPTSPVAPGECAINNDTDTKIVTYHFTSFGSLTAISSGSGGAIVYGGGGGSTAPTTYQTYNPNTGETTIGATTITPTAETPATTDTSTTPTTGEVLGTKVIADGALVRDDSKYIYVIKGNTKYHIANLAELAEYKGLTITDVDDADLLAYTTTTNKVYANSMLIRSKTDMKIYVIKEGKKKHVLNLEELRKNYLGLPIYNVSDLTIGQY